MSGWTMETTHWSVVLGAGDSDPDLRKRSLEYLCQHYWKPVFALLHRVHGLEPARAEDLTQDFFLHLLDRDVVSRADPRIGRFRTYLKSCLRNFLTDRQRWESRLKRGGGARVLSIDVGEDTSWILPAEPDDDPGVVLDREWARQLVQLALADLEQRLEQQGKAEVFAIFNEYRGPGAEDDLTYKALAERHGTTQWVVWRQLSYATDLLRTCIRQQVSRTVEPAHVEDEMQTLLDLYG